MNTIECKANYAMDRIDTLDKSIQKITRELQPWNDLQDSLAAIGVSCYDSKGQFKSMYDLFGDIANAIDFSDPKSSLHMYNAETGDETMTISNSVNVGTGSTAGNAYVYSTTTYPNTNSTWQINIPNSNFEPYNITIDGKTLNDYLRDCVSEELTKSKEEKKDMFGFSKFQFGPIKDGSVALSIRGVAVKNAAGEWVCYDEKADEIVSVDGLTFDCSGMIYAMPVAIKDIQMGDVIIHNKHYCYVMDGDENLLQVIDVSDSSVKEIMPTKSPFGFNFITKVVSLIDTKGANADNPFGNVLPFMMMKDGNFDDIMPLLLMNGNGGFKMDNPMMMYFLMSKNSNMRDMLPFLLMQSKS